MGYHFSFIRFAEIKKLNTACWQICRETGTIIRCWGGCKVVRLIWRGFRSHLTELYKHLLFDWKRDFRNLPSRHFNNVKIHMHCL